MDSQHFDKINSLGVSLFFFLVIALLLTRYTYWAWKKINWKEMKAAFVGCMTILIIIVIGLITLLLIRVGFLPAELLFPLK